MSTPLWNKKLKCPFCRTEFETTRMRSSVIKVTEKMTDFGNIYEGECPYFYSITACPECTFASLNKDFETVRPEYEPKVMEVSKKIRLTGRKKPDIFQLGSCSPDVAIKRHELALAFMKFRIYKDLGSIAGMNMHLVWIHRLTKDIEKEKVALGDAIKAYQEFFDKGGDMPETLGEPGVLYLIGELHRRLGMDKEARRFYERALMSREIKSFPRIAELTRDMMLVAKEHMERVLKP